jgi:hypothetical protein
MLNCGVCETAAWRRRADGDGVRRIEARGAGRTYDDGLECRHGASPGVLLRVSGRVGSR